MTKFQSVFRLLLVSGSLIAAVQCGGGSSGGQNQDGVGARGSSMGGAMANTGGTKPVVMYKPAKFSTNFDGADAVVAQNPPSPFTAGSTAQIDASNKYSGTKSVKIT